VNPDNIYSILEARQLKKAYDSEYEAGGYSESEHSSSSSSSFQSREAVQIYPQNVSLKLRISEYSQF